MALVRAVVIGTIGLGLLSIGLWGAAAPPTPVIDPADPGSGTPGDEPCRNGCSLGHHDVPVLTEAAFVTLVEQYAREPMSAASPALESLLFHGAETSRFLERSSDLALDAERRAFLDHELSRRHAWVEIRLVTADGAEPVRLPPTRVPLDVKQHLAPLHPGLPPMEFNGTVKRVGLAHLWTRF